MKKVFVGYRLMPRPGVTFPVPEFSSELKTEQGRANEIERKKAEYEQLLTVTPYTATFAEVCLIAPGKEKVVLYKAESRGPESGKASVCQAIRSFLLNNFSGAWSDEIIERRAMGQQITASIWKLMRAQLPGPEDVPGPELAKAAKPVKGKKDPVIVAPEQKEAKDEPVVIIGFDPRRFLKVLGIELSLPLPGNEPLPPGLWYGNTDHRDIEEAVLPKPECKLLSWPHVIQARRPRPELAEEERLKDPDVAKYDKLFKDWVGPGQDPEQDARIALTWASQLNFKPGD